MLRVHYYLVFEIVIHFFHWLTAYTLCELIIFYGKGILCTLKYEYYFIGLKL